MMTMHRACAAFVLALLAAGCSQEPPETRLINEAVEALGGAAAIQGATTLVVEGTGTAGNIGQNLSPDAPLPEYEITEYRRTMDLGAGRVRTEMARTPRFPTAIGGGRLNQGLDGDVAYNIGGPQNAATRASAMVARDRRLEWLHHPLTVIRAALDPGAQVGNFRDEGLLQLLDVTTAKGDMVTVALDRGSHLPVRVTSTGYNANLGDVVIESRFADYATTGGLNLPSHISTTLDGQNQLDLMVSAYAVNGAATDLAAPADVASAAEPPTLPSYEIAPQQVARGIWLLPGSHNSVVLEFEDHLTLVEVPLNESRAQAVIAAAKTLKPEKPLTHVIMTHHHFDHSGGLRAAVAEGLTIITHRGNEGFVDAMTERKHTLVPDALSAAPKTANIESVEDEMMLKDEKGPMEVRLYHVKNSDHSTTMLMAFVPSEGLLIQADMYGPNFATFPGWDTLQQNLADRGIKVDKHLPIHGTLQTAKEVADTVAAKQGGRT